MQTDIIRINADGVGFEQAIAETRAAAEYRGLSPKESLRLQLLAEEMTGMLRSLTGEPEADFSVSSTGREFCLSLVTHTEMYSDKRRRLLEVSTSGRNAAAVGVMGKLRAIIDAVLEPTSAGLPTYYAAGWLEPELDPTGMVNTWSLNTYRSAAEPADETERDELERSIVANIADEVRIGIRGDRVELQIFKTF